MEVLPNDMKITQAGYHESLLGQHERPHVGANHEGNEERQQHEQNQWTLPSVTDPEGDVERHGVGNENAQDRGRYPVVERADEEGRIRDVRVDEELRVDMPVPRKRVPTHRVASLERDNQSREERDEEEQEHPSATNDAQPVRRAVPAQPTGTFGGRRF